MTTWVFLRGLTRDSRHWGHFPRVFGETLANAAIVALDFPGNGAANAEKSPATIEALVEFCRSTLVLRGVAPPYYVLAMSLGAMVTVSWAARYPKEIQACVLINTSLRPLAPFYRRLRPANYLPILRLLLLGDRADPEAAILRMTSRQVAQTSVVLADWRRFRHEHPVARGNALRQLLAAARFRAPATRPAARILVLASRCDMLVDVRCSRTLATAWRTEFAEHPSAGHDLPLDDGAWVAHKVREWLLMSSAG